MIKARNKKLSMILVLAMLMTMFVGVGTASAASIEYDPINVPTYSTSTTAQSVDAQVLIDVDDAIVFANKESIVTAKLPSNVEFRSGASDVTLEVVGSVANLTASAAIKSSGAADLYVNAGATSGSCKLLLTFSGLVVKSGSGDLNVTMMAPSGSAFPSGSITIAKIAGKSSIQVLAGNQVSFGDNGGFIDGMTIAEGSAGTLEYGDEITFKLPKGFKWDNNYFAIGGGWGFDGCNNLSYAPSPYYMAPTANNCYEYWLDDNARELVVRINHIPDTNQAGRITVGTDSFEALDDSFYPYIIVEDNAKFGDITVAVSSTNDKGPDADIVVATYGDYTAKVEPGTTEEVYAGRCEQELGEFTIEEAIAGSLVGNRTIYLELPKGVEWDYDKMNTYPDVEIEEGDIGLGSWSKVGTDDRKLKLVVDFSSYEEASILSFEDMYVKIEPTVEEGPIEITVSGNAGAEGTVKVADCIRPITVKAENPTKVEIGAMNQKAADILIIEEIDEAIFDGEYNRIEITLPRGIYFASEPTVEVEEGDLEIDEVELIDSQFNKDGALLITIDYASSKKSIIRISDVFLTVDRTVPEGKVLAKFEGALNWDLSDIDSDWDYIEAIRELLSDDSLGCTAFVDWATDESIGSVEIATTITPKQGGYAKFVIGSNIYEVGGVPYVMDAVPYIKDSRSYVPMRFLAEMLGAEVTWEQADQTVTLTNGEVTAVFTIGSTSYTVNGEALTADVAPEIVNDRAYLPARFVAEAFGAQVGWDEGLQTVLIQR